MSSFEHLCSLISIREVCLRAPLNPWPSPAQIRLKWVWSWLHWDLFDLRGLLAESSCCCWMPSTYCVYILIMPLFTVFNRNSFLLAAGSPLLSAQAVFHTPERCLSQIINICWLNVSHPAGSHFTYELVFMHKCDSQGQMPVSKNRRAAIVKKLLLSQCVPDPNPEHLCLHQGWNNSCRAEFQATTEHLMLKRPLIKKIVAISSNVAPIFSFLLYRNDEKEYALKQIEGTGISMSACREIAVSCNFFLVSEALDHCLIIKEKFNTFAKYSTLLSSWDWDEQIHVWSQDVVSLA